MFLQGVTNIHKTNGWYFVCIEKSLFLDYMVFFYSINMFLSFTIDECVCHTLQKVKLGKI